MTESICKILGIDEELYLKACRDIAKMYVGTDSFTTSTMDIIGYFELEDTPKNKLVITAIMKAVQVATLLDSFGACNNE